jgi:hypothetical protein
MRGRDLTRMTQCYCAQTSAPFLTAAIQIPFCVSDFTQQAGLRGAQRLDAQPLIGSEPRVLQLKRQLGQLCFLPLASMDYFSKAQPIALPTTVTPSISEKEPLVEPEFAAPPNPPHPKKSKFRKALFIIVHFFLLFVFFRWISRKIHHHKHLCHHPHPPHAHDIFEYHDGVRYCIRSFIIATNVL